MNIKSLLLGSAAALVAVSGARAADAVVVAEPETAEYVKICDVYGAGYYYIPGTETCLRISGFAQYDIGVGDVLGIHTTKYTVDSTAPDGFTEQDYDTYYKRARFRLDVDARSETELGTLRGFVRVNLDHATAVQGLALSIDPTAPGISALDGTSFGGVDSPTTVGVDFAFIELGGFHIGWGDSYFGIVTGYQGGTINNDALSLAAQPYGTHQIAYTFDGGNGFSATVALEDGGSFQPIDDYVPHVVAGASFTQGWGGVSFVGAYDSVAEEGAFKARLDVKASDAASLWVMAGYDTSKDESNAYATWGGQWAVWGGGSFKASEKATINAELGYDEAEDFQALASVDYEVVPGMTVTPEISYFDNLNDGANGSVIGYLRFRRSF